MISAEQARAIARWWANHLKGAPLMDNGEPTQALMMQILTSYNHPLPSEQVERFEAVLTELIEQEQPGYISVDYHPDEILFQAGEISGVKLASRLPIKTVVWTESMTCKLGYGGQIQVIPSVELQEAQ